MLVAEHIWMQYIYLSWSQRRKRRNVSNTMREKRDLRLMDMTDFLKPFLPWCVLQRTYIFAFLLSSRLFIRPHQLFAEVCQVRQAWITCSFSSLLHCDQLWYVCKTVKLEAVDEWFIIVPVFILPYWIWQPNPTKDSQTFHNSDGAADAWLCTSEY